MNNFNEGFLVVGRVGGRLSLWHGILISFKLFADDYVKYEILFSTISIKFFHQKRPNIILNEEHKWKYEQFISFHILDIDSSNPELCEPQIAHKLFYITAFFFQFLRCGGVERERNA